MEVVEEEYDFSFGELGDIWLDYHVKTYNTDQKNYIESLSNYRKVVSRVTSGKEVLVEEFFINHSPNFDHKISTLSKIINLVESLGDSYSHTEESEEETYDTDYEQNVFGTRYSVFKRLESEGDINEDIGVINAKSQLVQCADKLKVSKERLENYLEKLKGY